MSFVDPNARIYCQRKRTCPLCLITEKDKEFVQYSLNEVEKIIKYHETKQDDGFIIDYYKNCKKKYEEILNGK